MKYRLILFNRTIPNAMRSIFPTLFLCLSFLTSHSQQQVLKITDGTGISLEELDIEIEVVGNVATTITKMTFYNSTERILEGELNFPLAEGQSVFRFAMDVNGKLREGVTVEKELGQKAFEGVVRQVVDPGLLEMTEGNNYKSRVYPIPAMGRKTILIGYEEELKDDGASVYQLLMDYGQVSKFNLKVEVVNQELKPEIRKSELVNFRFKRWRSSYIAEHTETDFNASGVFGFHIPKSLEQQVYRQRSGEEDFFYINMTPRFVKVEKEKPSSVSIFWDVSASAKKRDLEGELTLIKNYISRLGVAQVHVLPFSNQINDHRGFDITNGNSDSLIAYIRSLSYDGGTSFKRLNLPDMEYEEILLFTDGISNLDELDEFDKIPVTYTISSSKSTDPSLLRSLAESTGGAYIDLLKFSELEALEALSNLKYQFLGATYDDEKIDELYPGRATTLKENEPFTLAGKVSPGQKARMRLHFGVPGKILESYKLNIKKKENSTSIRRLWANKKLADLMFREKANQKEITALGKEYGLVTPYTSLIILESLADYVLYEIEPPADLKPQYDSIMANRQEEQDMSESEIIALIFDDDHEDRIEWWRGEKDMRAPVKPPVQENNIEPAPATPAESAEPEHESEVETVERENLVRDHQINGRIISQDRSPLYGARIQIQGTRWGTSADEAGRYSLMARKDDTVIVQYISFETQKIPVNGRNKIDVTLMESTAVLESVVVRSVQSVPQNRVETRTYAVPARRNTRVLACPRFGGSVEATISTLPGVSREPQSTVTSDVFEYFDAGPNPLYMVDGVLKKASKVSYLPIDDILSSNFIKGQNAVELFGDTAIDGVVVIMTKSMGKNLVLPDSITAKFEQEFVIKDWEPDEPYIDSLKNTPIEKRYARYLKFREEYGNAPSFYLSVGNLFIKSGQEKDGLRILSNIAELEIENHEQLKILAHRYKELKQYDICVYLFERIYELRTFEPQSARDLALAYQANGDFQKALDLFRELVMSEYNHELDDRFVTLRSTVLFEMNNLIARHGDSLDLSEIPDTLITHMPVDVRVVLQWNALESDMDLWILEPNGDKCYYSRTNTRIGGRITEDYMDGYGPEEYLLKDAMPGEYIVKVDYFDDRIQKVSGPVTLQLTIFTNYGSPNQESRDLTLQLLEEDDEIEVARFTWAN